MNYIIISAHDSTSEQRAHDINRELYKISRPNWSEADVTKYWLPMYQNGEDWAFGYEDTDWLPVSNDSDVTILKDLLSQDATQAERDALAGFIESKKGDKIFFKDIIPSTITKLTQVEIEALGWFSDANLGI